MGWIADILNEIKDVPLSAVLKERLALADQKYEAVINENTDLKRQIQELKGEVATLRTQIQAQATNNLSKDTERVLAYYFMAERERRDVGIAAASLQMERGILQYHLDLLRRNNFARSTGGNYLHHHTYWALTPEGRRYAVEHNVIRET